MNRRHMLGSAALATVGGLSAPAIAKGVTTADTLANPDAELLRLADQFFAFSAERDHVCARTEDHPIGHPEYKRLWKILDDGIREYHARLNVLCEMPAHTPAGWRVKARLLRYRAEHDHENTPTPGDDALMVSVAEMIEAAFPA